MFNEILRAISREYNWPDNRPQERSAAVVQRPVLESYAGQYDADGTAVTIRLQSDQLSIQAEPLGPSALRLYPFTEDRFFIQESSDFHVHFAKDSKGNVLELQIEAGPDRAIARRVK